MACTARPSHSRRRRAIVALLALVVVGGVLGGCARKAAVVPAPSAGGLHAVAPAALSLMSASDKASKIASSFPVQVPVAAGYVLRGEAQGDSAWDYSVVVTGTPDAVASWYAAAYRNAEWSVVSSAGNTITLLKNGAESRLTFGKAQDTPAQTKVDAIVGVGTQVLQTQ